MKKNLKNIGRVALSGALVLSMVLCNGSVVSAEKVSKQESVFVNAGADGSITGITVSDWLKNSGSVSGALKDSSSLTDISNVKGNETFSQNGTDMSWNTSGQDIYYQGKTDKKLPVSMKITYKLDGKEIAAKDLPGKSGKVEIHVQYTNNSKQTKTIQGKKETIYTPFVMVTAMILSNDNFSNVEIDNGRVINEGSNNIVVGIGMPGLADSLDLDKDFSDKITSDFTIKADAKDFTMENTYTYGSASLLNDIDLDDVDDLDDLEDKLDDLTDAAEKLVDGSDSLAENMQTYSDKMGDLRSSIKTYEKKGVNKLTGGINTLAKNGPKLVKGVNTYADGVTQFADGTVQYVNGAATLANGSIQLYKAVATLPAKITQFDKVWRRKSLAGKVAGDEKVAGLPAGQLFQKCTGPLHAVKIQKAHPALPLQKGDEAAGAQHPQLRVVPAGQGFAAHDLETVGIDKKLKIKLEFLLFQPAGDLQQQLAFLLADLAVLRAADAAFLPLPAGGQGALAGMEQHGIQLPVLCFQRVDPCCGILWIQRMACTVVFL